MYQSPCHNSLEPITSIITIIPEIVLCIHSQVGTTEASYRTFGYREIYLWYHISQKNYINTLYPYFKTLYRYISKITTLIIGDLIIDLLFVQLDLIHCFYLVYFLYIINSIVYLIFVMYILCYNHC